MRKLLLFLLLLATFMSFTSCAAPKELQTHSNQTLNEQSDSEKTVDSLAIYREQARVNKEESEQWKRLYNLSTSEDFEFNYKKYDTGQPTNPDTGTPPIAEEGNIKKSKKTDISEQENYISQEKYNLIFEKLDSVMVSSSEKDTRVSELAMQVETLSKSGYPKWIKALAWSGGVAWVALIAWGIFRIRKWILKKIG